MDDKIEKENYLLDIVSFLYLINSKDDNNCLLSGFGSLIYIFRFFFLNGILLKHLN